VFSLRLFFSEALYFCAEIRFCGVLQNLDFYDAQIGEFPKPAPLGEKVIKLNHTDKVSTRPLGKRTLTFSRHGCLYPSHQVRVRALETEVDERPVDLVDHSAHRNIPRDRAESIMGLLDR
jgi:hypothetical protein